MNRFTGLSKCASHFFQVFLGLSTLLISLAPPLGKNCKRKANVQIVNVIYEWKMKGKKGKNNQKTTIQVLICPSFFPLPCLAIRSVTIHLFLHAMLNLWILLFGKVTFSSIIYFYSLHNSFTVCLTWNILKWGKGLFPCLCHIRMALRNPSLTAMLLTCIFCHYKNLQVFYNIIDHSFNLQISAFIQNLLKYFSLLFFYVWEVYLLEKSCTSSYL